MLDNIKIMQKLSIMFHTNLKCNTFHSYSYIYCDLLVQSTEQKIKIHLGSYGMENFP